MEQLPKDQTMWNIVFTLLFAAMFAGIYWLLMHGIDRFELIYYATPTDFVLVSLATYRLIRLITYDKIFQPVRNLFLVQQPDGSYKKEGGGPRRTIAELLECMWCTGLWSALVALTLYVIAPIGTFLILVLAIAAVGSFLQNFSQMIARIGN